MRWSTVQYSTVQHEDEVSHTKLNDDEDEDINVDNSINLNINLVL